MEQSHHDESRAQRHKGIVAAAAETINSTTTAAVLAEKLSTSTPLRATLTSSLCT